MTTATLKAADLTPDGFLDLIGNLDPPDAELPRRVWMEAADGWAFDWWPGLEHNLNWCGAGREPTEEHAGGCLSRSTAGRLFARDGELRWRVIRALGEPYWRTVFLGNSDWVGDALEDCSDRLDGLQPRRDRLFLWGQQREEVPGEWIVLRIPHRFRYPVVGNPGRVSALVEQWTDEAGEPHFLRLCDLGPVEPAEGESDAST